MISISKHDIDCWEGFLKLLNRSPDHGISVFLSFLDDSEATEAVLLRETVARIKQDLSSANAVVYDDDGDNTEISKKIQKSHVVIVFCTPAYSLAAERGGTKNLVLQAISRQLRLRCLPIIPIFWSGEFLQAVPELWQKYYRPEVQLAEIYKEAGEALWPVLNKRLSLHALLNGTGVLDVPLSYEEHCFVVMILSKLSRAKNTAIHAHNVLLRALHFFSARPVQYRAQIVTTLFGLGSFYKYNKLPQALTIFQRAVQLSLLLPQEPEDHLLLQSSAFRLWTIELVNQNIHRVEQSAREIIGITKRFIVLLHQKYKHLISIGTRYHAHLILLLELYVYLIRNTQSDLSLSVSMSLLSFHEGTFGNTHPVLIQPLLNSTKSYPPDAPEVLLLINKALAIASSSAGLSKNLLPLILVRKAQYLSAKKKMGTDDVKQVNVLLKDALALTLRDPEPSGSELASILDCLIKNNLSAPLTHFHEIMGYMYYSLALHRKYKVYQGLINCAEYFARLFFSWQLPEFAKIFAYYALFCAEHDSAYLPAGAPSGLLEMRRDAERIWRIAMAETGSKFEYAETKIGLAPSSTQQLTSGLIEPSKAWSRLKILPFSEYLTGDEGNLSAIFSAFLEYFESLSSANAKKMKQVFYLSLPTHFDQTALKYFIESLDKIGWITHVSAGISRDSVEKEHINDSCAALIIVTPETATDEQQQVCIDRVLQINACAALPVIPILYTGEKGDIPEKLRSFISVMQHPWLHDYAHFLDLYVKQLFHLAMRCGLVTYFLNTKNKVVIDQDLIPVMIWIAAALSGSSDGIVLKNVPYLIKLAFTLITINNAQRSCPMSALIQLLTLLQKYQMFAEYNQCVLWLEDRLNPAQSAQDAKLLMQILSAWTKVPDWSNVLKLKVLPPHSLQIISPIVQQSCSTRVNLFEGHPIMPTGMLPVNTLSLSQSQAVQHPKAVEIYTLARQQISEIVLRLGTTADELIFWIESLAKFAPLSNPSLFPIDDKEEEQLWNLMLTVAMNHATNHMAQVIACCKKLIALYLLRENFVAALGVMQRCMALLQKHMPQDQQALQDSATIVQTLEKLSHNWSNGRTLIGAVLQRMFTDSPQIPSAINSNIWDTSWAQPWKNNASLNLSSHLKILDQDFSSNFIINNAKLAMDALMAAGLFAIAKPYILKLQTALSNDPKDKFFHLIIKENLTILALQSGDIPLAITYLNQDIEFQRPNLRQRILELELWAHSSFLSVNQQYSLEKVNLFYQQNQQNLAPEAITAKMMQSDCNIFEQQAFLSLLLIILNDQQDSQGLQFLLSCFSALQTVQQQKEEASSARLLLSVCIVLAQEYARKQQGAEQEKYLIGALQLCAKDKNIDWRISVRILLALADAKQQQKAFQEAAQQVKEAVEQVRQNDPNDIALLKLYKRWISLLYILQDNAALLTVWHAILALCEHILAMVWTQKVECYQNLAMLYETDKNWPKAIEMWKQYLELVKKYTADDIGLQKAYQWPILTAECALLYAQKQQEEDEQKNRHLSTLHPG